MKDGFWLNEKLTMAIHGSGCGVLQRGGCRVNYYNAKSIPVKETVKSGSISIKSVELNRQMRIIFYE
jgi:hypothetical protein